MCARLADLAEFSETLCKTLKRLFAFSRFRFFFSDPVSENEPEYLSYRFGRLNATYSHNRLLFFPYKQYMRLKNGYDKFYF